MSKILSPGAVKLLKKPWLWILAVAVSAAIWGLCYYWVSRTPIDKKFNVWVGTSFRLNDDLKGKIENTCYAAGMEECFITSYNPSDGAYAAAFAMQASSTDVFILHKDEALAEAEAGVFRELPGRYKSDKSLDYVADGAVAQTVGVRFIGDYYVFIGKESVKPDSLLFSVFDVIIEYGLTVSEGDAQ